SASAATRSSRSGTGATPVSTNATPTPLPALVFHASVAPTSYGKAVVGEPPNDALRTCSARSGKTPATRDSSAMRSAGISATTALAVGTEDATWPPTCSTAVDAARSDVEETTTRTALLAVATTATDATRAKATAAALMRRAGRNAIVALICAAPSSSCGRRSLATPSRSWLPGGLLERPGADERFRIG